MYKNKLQEFCQKKRLDLPIYNTIRLESKDHKPRFVSNVKINLNNIEVNGKVKNKKKDAEISAAEHCLNRLEKYLKLQKKDIFPKHETHILVDLENIKLGDLRDRYNFKNVMFHIFAVENSSCLSTLKSDDYIYHTVKSTKRDAADVLLIMFVSKILDKNINLIILTQDHFGSALMDCIDQSKHKLNSYHLLSKSDELETFFKTDILN